METNLQQYIKSILLIARQEGPVQVSKDWKVDADVDDVVDRFVALVKDIECHNPFPRPIPKRPEIPSVAYNAYNQACQDILAALAARRSHEHCPELDKGTAGD